MARIPTAQAQSVPGISPEIRTSAPTLPTGDTSYLQRGARATMQTAQQLGGAADDAHNAATAMFQAQQRIKQREQAVTRIESLDEINQQVQQLYLSADEGGNLAKADQVRQLRDQVASVLDSGLQNYAAGSDEDRLIFTEELARTRGKWMSTITERGIQAGRAALDDQANKKVAELSGLVASDPAALPDAQAELAEWMTLNYAPGAPPEEEEAAFMAGMETIATTAVDYLLEGGEYDKAMERLNDPTIQPYLTPGRSRQLRLSIYQGQAKQREVQAVIDAKVRVLEEAGLSGAELKRATTAVVTGHDILAPRPRGPMTLADKINELEAATGTPATQAQVEKLAGAHIPTTKEGGRFGSSLRGRAGEFLSEMSDEFSAGLLSPQDFNDYLTFAAIFQEVDPVSGTRRELPLPVREALEAQGISPNQLNTQGGVEQMQRARDNFAGPVATQDRGENTMSPEAQAAIGALAPAAQALAQAEASVPGIGEGAEPQATLEAVDTAGINFFDLAELITGPISGVQQGVSEIPWVGQYFQAAEVRQARQAFRLLKPAVAAILRRTDRYGDGERKDISDRLDNLDSHLLTEPQAMKHDMIGLDNWLAGEEQYYAETLEKEGEVSGQRYRDLQDQLNAIKFVRKVLGVPPTINSEEEYHEMVRERGLKPGDKVIWGPANKVVEIAPLGGDQ